MDIKLSHSLLTQYLKTNASPDQIAEALSLCGPTVDHLEKTKNDWIYHIEVITNRVDSASALGIAREATAILPQFDYTAKLINDPYKSSFSIKSSKLPQPVKATITNPNLVYRFACIAISNVKVKPSPKSTIKLLQNADERGINNLIDITNELTLRFGQPAHIFDLDRIKAKKMKVREAKPKEKITTLDGKTHQLLGGEIVIEDGAGRIIDLCGVMGGDLSSITSKTKNVLLFVQTYEPKHIRQTSLAHQKRTLAAQLFEKQTDPELVLPVLQVGTKMVLDRAGGHISSSILDIYPNPPKSKTVSIDLKWLATFSGVEISKTKIKTILNSLGFSTKGKQNKLDVTVPSWRHHDINLPQDIAEEVVRVYGYFRLPSNIPLTKLPSKDTNEALTLEYKTRQLVSSLGFTEIYNYSLVSKQLLSQSKFSTTNLFKLQNPLSSDYEYMRPTLIPSLLQNLADNQATSALPLKIFELSNTYTKTSTHKLAQETPTLTLATLGETFRQVKGYLGYLLDHLQIDWQLDLKTTPDSIFLPEQSAVIQINSGKKIGTIGIPQNQVLKNFALPNQVVILELDFQILSESASLIKQFRPIPSTTPIIEDLTFTLPPKTHIGPLITTINHLDPLINQVELKTSYQNNFTFTIYYQHSTKQLTDSLISPIRSQIVKSVVNKHQAKLVGSLK